MKNPLARALLVLALAPLASADSFRCTQFPIGCPPKTAGLVPVYQLVTIDNGLGNRGCPNAQPCSAHPWYFALRDTATAVCQQLGCSYLYSQPLV